MAAKWSSLLTRTPGKAVHENPFSFGRRSIALAVALTLCAGSIVIACQVPVFRFALERWPADKYEVVILHQGSIDEVDQKRINRLRQSDHTSPVPANFGVEVVDVGTTADAELRQLWQERAVAERPLVVTLYPRNAQEVPDRIADVSPLTDESVEQLVDSPTRQEIVSRLVDGDSAVWVFVPCGDDAQDAVALKTLKEQVLRNEKELELPPQDEIEADEFFSEETNIELRLSFSIVTLDRNDPRERFMLQMLMESEPDLLSLDQPMAFPVLGRGRVLYALVGKGIFADTIAMASSFIVGPCSCQVKEQNPGFDLLLAVDWDAKVGVNALSKPLPAKSAEPILLTIPPGKGK